MKRSSLLIVSICLCSVAAVAAEPAVVDASEFLDRSLPDCGLQAAIDALPKEGGVVELPEGEFVMERYLYLKSGTVLRGQGRKTVLRVGREEQRRDVTSDVKGSAKVPLAGDLTSLKPGRVVFAWRFIGKVPHLYIRHYRVKAIKGQTVVLDQPTRYDLLPRNKSQLSWGLATVLSADAVKGERTIQVDHPDLFKPGWAIRLGGKGDMWGHHFNVIESIDGNTLTLERPLNVNAKAGALVLHAFAMITADGEKNIGVESLDIQGWESPNKPRWGGFVLAGIHTARSETIRVRDVQVRDWNGDGFSFQAGKDLRVEDCKALRCRGRGFHPGTNFKNAEFVRLLSAENTDDGFYYCWHNSNVNLRDSALKDNDGDGVGGLGNPGDRQCTVEGNTITGNGRCGIQVNGGGASSGSVIRKNIVRDNSQSKPGTYPGIGLIAHSENAGGYLVEGNTVESTLDKPTQRIGIEERNGDPVRQEIERRGKTIVRTRLADNNIIRNNTVSGHRAADIKIVGRHTLCEGNTAEKVVTELTPPLEDLAKTEGEK